MLARNMGTADRLIRFTFAVAVVALYLTGNITSTAAVILGILAAIFLVTSIVGFCPLYAPFKLSTRGKQS
ncbi:MAG: DUF2892 domain-containing protein [Anaerolineales bacterium]